MRPPARYDEPFYWWGPRWDTPQPRTLRGLLRDGTIDAWRAAHIWAALARKQSLAVVSGPSGSGKTTLLTAFCELLPPETQRVYVRGCFEDFAFLRDPRIDPVRTVLLVNELSPHLPVYLWGPGVAAVLQAASQGCMVLTTAHATTALDFVRSLAGSPLRLPAQLIAAVGIVVALDNDAAVDGRRIVAGIWRLTATRTGVAIEQLEDTRDDPRLEAARTDWFPEPEIRQRAETLMAHAAGSEPDLPAVRILPGDSSHEYRGAAP